MSSTVWKYTLRFLSHSIKSTPLATFRAPPNICLTTSTAFMSMATETKRLRANHEKPVIGTHNGTFHCDEVLACFMLKQLPEYENAKIFRSRDNDKLHAQCDIIVDVGGEFDHERKLYDHHQKSFKETLSSLRPELGDSYNLRLSSAGLVYAHYGERVLQSILQRHRSIEISASDLRLTFVQIYHNFISEIDAIDNGVPMFVDGDGADLKQQYKVYTHISARIGKLNPSWEDGDSVDVEERFLQAMAKVGEEFTATVCEIGGSWVKARQYVREALLGAKSVYKTGEILQLKRFCPWKVHLAALEAEHGLEGVPKLVLFNDGSSWRVAGVPVSPDSTLGRKFLPPAWRGLRDSELSQKVGIADLVFVHHTGFIGGAQSESAALAMAIKSLEWNDE